MGVYYHHTTQINWDNIQKSGELRPQWDLQRGCSTIHIARDPHVAADYAGDIMLEIDFNGKTFETNPGDDNRLYVVDIIPIRDVKKIEKDDWREVWVI